METLIQSSPHFDLDSRVDAFEEARRLHPSVDLARFLPPTDYPGYREALVELIRVELDLDWAEGRAKPLAAYCRRFPDLAGDPDLLRQIAFEEYRLRRQAGDPVEADHYRDRFGVDTADWQEVALPEGGEDFPETAVNDKISVVRGGPGGALFPVPDAASSWVESIPGGPDHRRALRELKRDKPESARKWAAARRALPEAGSEFLGFRLLEELGRGAFGRVFLAQQADMANRPVALKVAADIFSEKQTLCALQHTNIVPVYSFHQAARLQAVCMPYYGSTTLAHVYRHIQNRVGLPTSGKELVSTLNVRKSITRDGSAPTTHASQSGPPSHPAPGATPPLASADDAPPVAPAELRPESETWKKLEALSFTNAILWLAARIVDGLAHAHERGVVHRDLKPANILLTDDGTPMLLDFNLAVQSDVRGNPTAARVGGTLPYMPPETIQAFRAGPGAPDERGDIYAVGVILFNLLTGRHPFPSYKGRMQETVERMLADRLKPAPMLRPLNPSVSPAVESIVRRCLDPDPAKRYQKARHLQEDLERQMSHRPLKYAPEPSLRERLGKWRARHPRLTSTASVAGIALAVVLALAAVIGVGREQLRSFRAGNEFAAHRSEVRSIQVLMDGRHQPPEKLDQGLARSVRELARYGVSGDAVHASWERTNVRYLPDSDRVRLKEDVGELYFLMAKAAILKAEQAERDDERDVQLCSALRWNELAEAYSGDRLPRAIREQRADVYQMKGSKEESLRLRAELGMPVTPRDHYLVGHWLVKKGEYRRALPHLKTATRDDPESFSAWFVRGDAHRGAEQPEMAAMCYSSCIALRKEFAPAWRNRGNMYVHLRFYDDAIADFTRAIELQPDDTESYVARAICWMSLEKWANAEADLTLLIGRDDCPVRAYQLRANVREKLENPDGADSDFVYALERSPADELSWIGRAELLAERDPEAALAAVDRALKLNPLSMFALQQKAHILSDRLRRDADAIAVLNRAVREYPEYAPARAGRGVLLARTGNRDEALEDARAALHADSKPPNLYQVAGIFALTSRQDPDDRFQALQLLSAALRRGFGLDLVDHDTDLDPIRKDAEFTKIVAGAKRRAE